MKKKSERILGLMGIVVIITLFSGAGSAAPGDNLGFVTVPVLSGSCCGIGIDYDGTSILYTNYLDPTVYKTDFSGANLGSVPLINPDGSGFSGGLNAIAYNFNDNMLYGGGWSNTNLYKTDLSTGVTTLVKLNAVPPAFNFIDGLAWDPTDNTFWMSDDIQCNVEHLDVLGNDIGGFNGCTDLGLPANSGLAVSLNGFLWYGTDGSGLIYRLDTTTSPPTNLGVFASPGGRDEDMVCGPKYTKPDSSVVETLLSKDAYNNQFAIIEVADGTCISPAEPKGSISGMKFNDLNNNGVNDAEPGLPGWTITLTDSLGNTISTTTGATGSYAFTGLAPDTYTVAEVLQAGWMQTAPLPVPPGTYTVTITQAAEQVTGKDFGNFREQPPVELTASCVETVNPAGKNIPTAGANPMSGQNPDGFYMIGASDPAADVFVKDTGSGTVFGPFPSGTNIKYTEANGAEPVSKTIGGPNSAVDWHIKGTGDAAVYAMLGNVISPEVSCLVPPPPK